MRHFLLRFLRDRRASGTVFMVTMLPAFLAIAGIAIDAAAAYRTRNMLQGAADAASLAATLALPDVTAAKAAAVKYAQLNLPNYSNILAAADVQAGNWDATTKTFTLNGTPVNSIRVTTQMTAAAGNAMPTTFLKLVGVDHIDISTQAVAAAEQPKLWVALVLDNTGSMCQTDTDTRTNGPCPNPDPGSKIAQLKAATHNLIDMLKGAAARDGDVQVAIIPFTRDVNVGTDKAGSSWLQFSDFPAAALPAPAATVGPGSNCPWTKTANGFQCQTSPTNDPNSYSARINPSVPSSGTYKGYICPSLDAVGHYYNGCYDSQTLTTDKKGNPTSWKHTWIANSTSTWSGCVTDRTQDYDTTNAAPASTAALFPADNSDSCPATPIMPLTYEWGALGTRVDQMSAGGKTNQTIGLVWGWQAMTQGSPLNPPELPQGTRRIIILLSDGLNTQDRWWGDGNHSTNVDARMTTACDNLKGVKDVTVYTVFVDINDTQGNSDILKNCATEPNDFKDLKSATDITKALSDIGRRIIRMRLVH